MPHAPAGNVPADAFLTMYSISKILGATTLIFFVVGTLYIFYLLNGAKGSSMQSREAAPDFFPERADSTGDADRAGMSQEDAPDDAFGETTNFPVSQGGTEPMLPHQLRYLHEIILSSQQVPSPVTDQRWYFVAQTAIHTTHIVVIPDGSAYVDVVLTQAPYNASRMRAESEFAQLFNGERADLCGFPFFIHVESDPVLKERGNLGLEYCGANKLEETE